MSNELAIVNEPQHQLLPTGLQILLNPEIHSVIRRLAVDMSNANGITPKHLIGQVAACYAVITRAVTWRLDPFAVACSTYQTPGGVIGHEGKLVQAIIENSGQIVGGVSYKMFGDWGKIAGKFVMEVSRKGHKYPVGTWKYEDEEGLGVTVSAQIINETEPRTLDFLLKEAQPRNSTLWATSPSRQIKYTAVRSFANHSVPGIFMGIPFDVDESLPEMRDITPIIEASEPPKKVAYYDMGHDAGSAGMPLEDAPNLNTKNYDEWLAGWQDASEKLRQQAPEMVEVTENVSVDEESEEGLPVDIDVEGFTADIEERVAAIEEYALLSELWEAEIEMVYPHLPPPLQDRIDTAYEAATEGLQAVSEQKDAG